MNDATLNVSEGTARVTIFAAQSNARTFDYQAGDIGTYSSPNCLQPQITSSQDTFPRQWVCSARCLIEGMFPNTFAGHYVENTGNTTLTFLEIFRDGTHLY